ncbi:SMP-30/gluconolactonase/LRE family protein [Streptosporangium sp. NPDC023963]|uniref:SMP-30/gluconolactonase/LRE family protein n=1 Tax=Streptosporangium sp. NPDC023963 TaxID=3155608 RepID=UPI00342293FD
MRREVRRFEARVASADSYLLGEGPVWDAGRERLLWVDIDAGHVFEGRLAGDSVRVDRRHEFGETVGAVVCDRDGRLLVAGRKGLLTVAGGDEPGRPSGAGDGGPSTSEGERGERAYLVDLIPEGKDSRLNDGACDPGGRFLVGSLALDDRHGQECLYRYETDGTVTTLDTDLALSNGLAWSPDLSTMYSVDSVPGTIWTRAYDAVTGAYGERRVLLEVSDGTPDGLCVDVDGNLWLALWGAGQVRGYSPRGEHLATVEVAAPNVTSVAFAGPRLDTLLITSARVGMTPADAARHPDAGRVFLADVGTRGLATPYWSGPAPTRRISE